MIEALTTNLEFGLAAAKRIVELSDDAWPDYFVELRRQRCLSRAIREMNSLLDMPGHRALVRRAFRRMGLEHTD